MGWKIMKNLRCSCCNGQLLKNDYSHNVICTRCGLVVEPQIQRVN